jgi:hypothetical protein
MWRSFPARDEITNAALDGRASVHRLDLPDSVQIVDSSTTSCEPVLVITRRLFLL